MSIVSEIVSWTTRAAVEAQIKMIWSRDSSAVAALHAAKLAI
jgi:hypothetical protein